MCAILSKKMATNAIESTIKYSSYRSLLTMSLQQKKHDYYFATISRDNHAHRTITSEEKAL